MNMQQFLETIHQFLSSKLNDVEIVILSDSDFPMAMDLIILSDNFDGMHQVDISNYLLNAFKAALGNDFYKGIYAFKGMTRDFYNKSFGNNSARLYTPNRADRTKIGASTVEI